MLFVFDLDGTLLQDDKTLSSFTITTIKRLSEQGHKIMIASGRSYDMALPYALALEMTGPMILNNGALIKSVDGLTVYREKTLPKDEQHMMIDHNHAQNLPFAIVADDGVHGPAYHPLYYYRKFKEMHPSSGLILHEFSSLESLYKVNAYKLFTIIEDESHFLQTQKTLQANTQSHFTQSMASYLDMLPANTNKGEALLWLLENENLSVDDVIVFGDNDNDVEMLSVSCFSYAVNNATIKAKKAAKFTTPHSNNDDGVATLLHAWLNEHKEGDLSWHKKL